MKLLIAVFVFQLKTLIRNFKSAGIMFILPVMFMAIFALAFGSSDGTVKFSLGVYQDSTSKEAGLRLKDIYTKIDEESSHIEIKITEFSTSEELNTAVNDETVAIGITLIMKNAEKAPFSATVISKESSQDLSILSGIVQQPLSGIFSQSMGTFETRILNKTVQEGSIYDLMVPGFIVYAIITLLPGIAQSFTSITEKKYTDRFAQSNIKSWQIIGGTVLYYIFVSAVQILLSYLTARLFGFSPIGNILVAAVPALLTSLFIIGVGLLIGALFIKSDAATNVGTILSIIFGFFSGSFIVGIGSVLEFTLFGRVFQFNDIMPTKWATEAMKKILLKNQGFSDITTELLIIGISGFVVILFGIIVYEKKQLSTKVE